MPSPTPPLLTCTLTPAYNRDYKSKREVLDSFSLGQDFILNDLQGPDAAWDGKPCNYQSLVDRHGTCFRVNVRYNKLRSLVTLQVVPGDVVPLIFSLSR